MKTNKKKWTPSRIFSTALLSLVGLAAIIFCILFAVPNSATPGKNVIARPDYIQVVNTHRYGFITGEGSGFFGFNSRIAAQAGTVNNIFDAYRRSVNYSVMYGILEGRMGDRFELMKVLDEEAMELANDGEEIWVPQKFYRSDIESDPIFRAGHNRTFIAFVYDDHREFKYDKNEPAIRYNIVYFSTSSTHNIAGNLASFDMFFIDTAALNQGNDQAAAYYALGLTGVARLHHTWRAAENATKLK